MWLFVFCGSINTFKILSSLVPQHSSLPMYHDHRSLLKATESFLGWVSVKRLAIGMLESPK